MTTPLSLAARQARLGALRDAIDASPGPGAMLLYSGSPPATPDDALSAQVLLGSVALALPSGSIAASAGLATYTLSVPRTGTASATGVVGWVRFVSQSGAVMFDCPVVEAPTTGPVQLSDTQLYAGGEVQLLSCVLSE